MPGKWEKREFYSFVSEQENGIRLLEFLVSHYTRHTREEWRQEILRGRLQCNTSVTTDPDHILKKHDRISYYPEETPEPEADLSFQIIYEDPDYLVIDKPGNLCTHPTGPFFRHTLWDLLCRKYGENVRFLNRLDRETSGLCIAARSRRAAAAGDNGNMIRHKEYLALVHGHFYGHVTAAGRLLPDRNSMIPKKKRFLFADHTGNAMGESAVTELFFEKEVPPDMTLVRAVPQTGRQHQIRATLYSLGFPLAGDKLYGLDETLFLKIRDQSFTEEDRKLLRFPRQALHSAVLDFIHPFTGKRIHCESPVPGFFLTGAAF